MEDKNISDMDNPKMNKKLRLFIIGAVVLTVIVLIAIFIWPFNLGQKLSKSVPDWYAVHFTNGVVYVGQIKSVNAETIVLKKAFYMQSYGATENPEGQTAQFYGLVRQGIEAPLLTDQVMFINRPVILFWERLDPQSDVVQRLNQQN